MVDSFGPSRCGKYVLKSFRIFGQKNIKQFEDFLVDQDRQFQNTQI